MVIQAVIGKGMIGSAAGRHLAMQTDPIALIGPDEPAVRADHHDVFGSHYDDGRIYHVLGRDVVWARMAERSIARYAEIEAQSGIPFHHEAGCSLCQSLARLRSWKGTRRRAIGLACASRICDVGHPAVVIHE